RRMQVVEEGPEPQESRAWLPSLVRGDDKGQRMDEGGRRVKESIPFACSRADEAEPVGLEVSKPAMDEPRGLPARAAREVPAIQEAGPQPSSSGISGDTGPDDPAPDHEDIEDGLLRLCEVGGPRSGVDLTRHPARSVSGPGTV